MTTTISDHKAIMTAAWEIAREAYVASYGFKNIMACGPKVTPVQATEGLCVYTPSPISLLFSKLNSALAVSIEAERDIEHVNACDPAIDHWLRDAERAWAAVTEIGFALRAAPVTRAEDAPLVMMAQIVDALMEAESLGEYLAAQERVRAAAYRLRCAGLGATPRRISQLLRQCHAHLSVMAEMDVYQPVCDSEDLPDGLSAAWPEAC